MPKLHINIFLYIGVSDSPRHRQRQSVKDRLLKRVQAFTDGENVDRCLVDIERMFEFA